VFSRNVGISLLLLAAAGLAIIAATLLVFGGVLPPYYERPVAQRPYAPPVFDFRLAEYAELEGWGGDDPEAAFAAFLKSCSVFQERDPASPANAREYLGPIHPDKSLGGLVGDWLAPCAKAAEIKPDRFPGPVSLRSAIRTFFETQFRPVAIREMSAPASASATRRPPPRIEETGLFTGYFEPVFAASRERRAGFDAPVFARPADLVDVDLGLFREALSGTRIAGRVEDNALVPYPDRKDINGGALEETAAPIAWMNANDLFFLQIQGSGRLEFEDGGALRIGYAGQNGHPYTAIGRIMVERGVMALEEISMQSIRDWLSGAAPQAARELREQNASYVFFEAREPVDGAAAGDGPLGAEGAPLTPGRSLAVDERYHTLGSPAWVDIEPVAALGAEPIRRLMIAQDAGGAVKGPVRGDIYWGTGEEAGAVAGAMRARGKLYVLVPRAVAARLQ